MNALMLQSLLLNELHNPNISDKTFIFDATESSTSCQVLEFLLGPLLPSWGLSHHKHIQLGGDLLSSACFWQNRKNCLQNDYFSVVRSSTVTVLQQLYAVLIDPIVKYALKKQSKKFEWVRLASFTCIYII